MTWLLTWWFLLKRLIGTITSYFARPLAPGTAGVLWSQHSQISSTCVGSVWDTTSLVFALLGDAAFDC